MFPNDEVVAYGRANGLGSDYNDIMTAFLRDYYSSNLSLTDLWGRAWAEGYRSINGFTDFPGIANSEFYAPLTHSLVLTRGTGDPTYSRATVAWEFDNEGKLILVPSGAARFGGARMVRNAVDKSRDISNAYWTKSGLNILSTTEVGPDGSATAVKLEGTNASANFFIGTQQLGVPGNEVLFGFSAKAGTATVIGIGNNAAGNALAYFDLSSVSATNVSGNNATITSLGNGWYACTVLQTIANSSTMLTIYEGSAYLGPFKTGNFTITDIFVDVVTGRSDKTPAEKIITGVLSAPYHGAGVDGVKWFETNKDGSAISESSLLGYHAEEARTNSLLYSRDVTNAAWAATNITPAKTATGIDNAANSASTLTAGAADATILQTLSLAAAARSSSAYVKRRTGTGNIYMTRDGGTNWTDITASVGSSWTRVKIENTSVLNPSVGFKIATSGDAIDVDCVQDEAGTKISSPIITTTTAVTRNADAETFPTASNWSDTAGWMLATVYRPDWDVVAGGVIGSATNGLLPLTTNTGAKAYDGSNTVNGPAGAPSGTVKMAATWGSGALQVAANGTAGTAGSYDGAWGLASIGIGASADSCYIKNVYIAQSALNATQLAQVTA